MKKTINIIMLTPFIVIGYAIGWMLEASNIGLCAGRSGVCKFAGKCYEDSIK